MDVTRMLEADHRQVEDLFARIEQTEGAARQPLLDELDTNLRAHMELEEDVVYPRLPMVTDEEAVQEATTEHELARKAMQDVLRLAPDDPGFGAALVAAKAGIAHHVEEEEGEVFPQLRKDGPSVLEEMATSFMKRRMELGMPMTVEGLSAAATKDELLAEAKQAGIDITDSATKEQVANALVEQMA
jgi:hemerythrin superfamily protein